MAYGINFILLNYVQHFTDLSINLIVKTVIILLFY